MVVTLFVIKQTQILKNIMNVLLIKIDFNGNQEWIKTFSFGSDDNGYSVQQTVDGGYILTGNVWNQGTFIKKILMVMRNGVICLMKMNMGRLVIQFYRH